MKYLNHIRIFIVEFLAICLIIFISEMLADVFKNNTLINKEQFISTMYRAIRLALFIRVLLSGLEFFDKWRKNKKSS